MRVRRKALGVLSTAAAAATAAVFTAPASANPYAGELTPGAPGGTASYFLNQAASSEAKAITG